ncbi:hypothetical protein BCEP27_20481 [Burkholderia cepacia]
MNGRRAAPVLLSVIGLSRDRAGQAGVTGVGAAHAGGRSRWGTARACVRAVQAGGVPARRFRCGSGCGND